LTDALGSTIALADPTGAITTDYTYDPYGVPTATGSPDSNDQQYTGQPNDGTGLDYYRARYYSPTLQRFISQDPAGSAGSGDNLYAYTADSPTNFTDPSGEQALPGCIIGAAIGAGGGAIGHWVQGKKYSFWDGAKDAATGCAMGAVGAWVGEAVGPLLTDGAGLAEEAAAGERAATSEIPELTLSKSRYPESAQHIEDAQAAGHPTELTIDRAGADANRASSLRDTDPMPGLDRDEYPPAMFQEGGDGASVRGTNPSDNRGAGASLGNQARGLPDGTVVRIVIVP
ncbi:MAG TPA: RHS repeat-associated core domain-containing protein, partial [Jatrophihabitans sp.]|nr:RHS repeat-associated core domain-containing protein [Jatrophihabitans sp.]